MLDSFWLIIAHYFTNLVEENLFGFSLRAGDDGDGPTRHYLPQETGRASTRPQTDIAPAAKSGAAHASSVEPVVDTSSIISETIYGVTEMGVVGEAQFVRELSVLVAPFFECFVSLSPG